MSVLRSKNNKELLVTCECGCEEGLHIIKVEPDECDEGVVYLSYISGNFYKEQDSTFWRVFKKKLKKIVAIICNKDFYYSDIRMTKEDFQEFKDYINQIGE